VEVLNYLPFRSGAKSYLVFGTPPLFKLMEDCNGALPVPDFSSNFTSPPFPNPSFSSSVFKGGTDLARFPRPRPFLIIPEFLGNQRQARQRHYPFPPGKSIAFLRVDGMTRSPQPSKAIVFRVACQSSGPCVQVLIVLPLALKLLLRVFPNS